MKKIILILTLIILATGCNTNKLANVKDQESEEFVYYNYLDELNIEDKIQITSDSIHRIDISDIAELRDFHDHVFIATIDSIEGNSTTVATGEFSTIPYTYGQLTVLDNLKGNLPEGQVKFARKGGTISVSDYEKDAPDYLVENDDKNREEQNNGTIDKNSTYYTFQSENDIQLEAGKTYLLYGSIYPETGYFVIMGAEYGAREISLNSSGESGFRSMPNKDSVQIKDNVTGDLESFEEIISKYFNK